MPENLPTQNDDNLVGLNHDVTRITNIVKESTSHLNDQFERMWQKAQILDEQVEVVSRKLLAEEHERHEGIASLKDENHQVKSGLKDLSQTLVSKHGELSTKQAELVQKTQLLDHAVHDLNATVGVQHQEIEHNINFMKQDLEQKNQALSKTLEQQVAALEAKLVQLNEQFNVGLDEVKKTSETQYQSILETLKETRLLFDSKLQQQSEAYQKEVDHLTERDIQLEAGINGLATQQIQTASHTHRLQKHTEQLEMQTSMLEQAIARLTQQQQDNWENQHQTNQTILQRLQALADIQNQQYLKTKGFVLLLLIVLVASWLVFGNQFKTQVAMIAQNTLTTQNNATTQAESQQAIQQDVTALEQKIQKDLASLETTVEQKLADQKQTTEATIAETKTELEQQVAVVKDNLDYNNTRLGGIFSSKLMNGSRGELLESDWLAQQNPENFTLVLKQNASKSGIFKVFEDFGYHLDTDVVAVQQGTEYMMIMGSYRTQEAAQEKWRWLPYSLTDEQQGVVQLSELVQQLE